jgi:hypothetical protein
VLITISSFHIKRNQSSKLDIIRNKSTVYLRVSVSDPGQPKMHWTQYDVETPNPCVEPRVLNPRKPVGIRIDNKRATKLHNPVEVVEVRANNNSADSHQYEVALNYYLKRKPSKDSCIRSGLLDIPEYSPPGSEFDIEDGYELIVFDSESRSSSLDLNLGSLAKALGLELGFSFHAESKHSKEIKEKTIHTVKKHLKLEKGDNQGVVHGRFYYRFNIGFERYFTTDNITWLPLNEDYIVPFEVWCNRPVYLPHTNDFQEQLNEAHKKRKEIKPQVKQWLSDKLIRAGLSSLGC